MSEEQAEFERLMQGVRDGSPEAVRTLLDRYGPHVLRTVRRTLNPRLRTRFDSTDFVQDVWASYFTHNAGPRMFERPEDLVAFLGRMARNRVVEEFRMHAQTARRERNRDR